MAKTASNIPKLIPTKLKDAILKKSGFDNMSEPISDRSWSILQDSIKDFVNAYNFKLKEEIQELKKNPNFLDHEVKNLEAKKLEHIGPTNFIRAVYSKSEATFSKATAETLCRFAFNGEKGWDDFISLNSELTKSYTFPQDLEKKAKQTAGSNNEPKEDKAKLLLPINIQKLKEFEYVFLEFAKEQTSISIEKIAVPLLALQTDLDDLMVKRHLGISSKKIVMSGLNVQEEIEKNERLIIVADGGIGKTTICKWIFTRFSSNGSNESIYFPLFISLSTKEQSIESALTSYFKESALTFEQIKSHLKAYIPIFIFDGLDEIPPVNRQIIKDIKTLGDHFNCKIVITTRPNDSIADFILYGYKHYKIESVNTINLPKLLISDSTILANFYDSIKDTQIPEEISGNNLFYTCLILDFLNNGKRSEYNSKGKIFERIIDYYYLQIWERTLKNKQLPPQFKHFHFLNGLSVMALVTGFPELFVTKNGNLLLDNTIVRTGRGINFKNLSNILSLVGIGNDFAEDIISLYTNSGMLIQQTEGYFEFSNKVIENYFQSRAIVELCFSNNFFFPFENNIYFIKQLQRLFFKQRNSLVWDIAAGLIKNPTTYLNEHYKNIPNWRLHWSKSYKKSLFFTSLVIGIRKEELPWSAKEPYILQLFYFSNFFKRQQALSFTEKAVLFLSFDTYLDFVKCSISTQSEFLLGEVLYWLPTYLKSSYGVEEYENIWDYLKLFPRNSLFQSFCHEALSGKKSANAYIYLVGERIKYLHKNEPLRMVQFYITEMSKEDENSPLFKIDPRLHVFKVNVGTIWDVLLIVHENVENAVRRFAEIIIHVALSSKIEALKDFAEYIIGITPFAKIDLFFGNILFERLKKTDNEEELKKLITLLTKCVYKGNIKTYENRLRQIVELGICFEEISWLYKNYLVTITKDDISEVPTFLKDSLLKLINSENFLEVCLGLGRLSVPVCFLSSEEKTKVVALLHHDESMVREYTISLLRIWKAKEFQAEIENYAFNFESEALGRSIALNMLMKWDCKYYEQWDNDKEQELLYMSMYATKVLYQQGKFSKEVAHDQLKYYGKVFSNCGTHKAIPTLLELREFIDGFGISIDHTLQEIQSRHGAYKRYLRA